VGAVLGGLTTAVDAFSMNPNQQNLVGNLAHNREANGEANREASKREDGSKSGEDKSRKSNSSEDVQNNVYHSREAQNSKEEVQNGEDVKNSWGQMKKKIVLKKNNEEEKEGNILGKEENGEKKNSNGEQESEKSKKARFTGKNEKVINKQEENLEQDGNFEEERRANHECSSLRRPSRSADFLHEEFSHSLMSSVIVREEHNNLGGNHNNLGGNNDLQQERRGSSNLQNNGQSSPEDGLVLTHSLAHIKEPLSHDGIPLVNTQKKKDPRLVSLQKGVIAVRRNVKNSQVPKDLQLVKNTQKFREKSANHNPQGLKQVEKSLPQYSSQKIIAKEKKHQIHQEEDINGINGIIKDTSGGFNNVIPEDNGINGIAAFALPMVSSAKVLREKDQENSNVMLEQDILDNHHILEPRSLKPGDLMQGNSNLEPESNNSHSLEPESSNVQALEPEGNTSGNKSKCDNPYCTEQGENCLLCFPGNAVGLAQRRCDRRKPLACARLSDPLHDPENPNRANQLPGPTSTAGQSEELKINTGANIHSGGNSSGRLNGGTEARLSTKLQ
jgi:hypothetical protein